MPPTPRPLALEEMGEDAAGAVGDVLDSRDFSTYTAILLDHMSWFLRK